MTPPLRAVLLSTSLLVLSACDESPAQPAEEVEQPDAGPDTDASMEPPVCTRGNEPLASDVTLREVALYQTVKVPLVADGAWVADRASPVVQGKDALVRVFVEPAEARAGRKLRAVLTLDNDGIETTLVAEHPQLVASTDAMLDSTFNFDVPAAALGASTALRVELLDPDCSDTGGAARFPATGTQALDATAIGAMHVEIVPITVNGRAPEVGEPVQEALRGSLRARFPVPDVQLTVHAPVTSEIALSGSSGWSELLSEVEALRAADAPEDDVYYLAVVTPEQDVSTYCFSGCVMSLTGPADDTAEAAGRAALVVNFADEDLRDVHVQALGRLHGRDNVSCGGVNPFPIDPDYPESDGTTQTWGWDAPSRTLVAPDALDMMTFGCAHDGQVIGVSDYTYAAIAERSKAVNRP